MPPAPRNASHAASSEAPASAAPSQPGASAWAKVRRDSVSSGTPTTITPIRSPSHQWPHRRGAADQGSALPSSSHSVPFVAVSAAAPQAPRASRRRS
ncbi:MAG: hypothetical protein QM792_11850 [Piscinibacter sp.]